MTDIFIDFQARVYLLSAGFSLAFGSMFAKTYRVHRIFTHSGGSICKDKMLQDTQLISLVCALLLLDSMVITLWVVTDPMEPHLSNLTLEISAIDRSVVYQPQVRFLDIRINSISIHFKLNQKVILLFNELMCSNIT
jgi:7 transmembrane sweet-taste receptor of 3 GCPR